MTIEKFIDTDFPSTQFTTTCLLPRGGWRCQSRFYAVLPQAIAKTALARVVISQRERTIAIRLMCDGLMAHTSYENRDLNSSAELFDGRASIKTDPRWCNWAASCNTTLPILKTALRPDYAP